MKVNSLLLFAVAIGCGLVAMLGLKQYMNNNQKVDVETVDVLVATSEIQAGVSLNETNTAFHAFSKDTCPPGAVTSRAEVEEMTLRAMAVPGETIMLAKLTAERGAAAEIPEGMRVITVPVNATTSHSGLLLPGNRVDIMVTYKRRTRSGLVPDTKMVLRYIEVFATDSLRDASSTEVQEVNSKNVSLLVTPEQAPILLKAADKGLLQLAMRSKFDGGDEERPLDYTWLDGESNPQLETEDPESYVATEEPSADPTDVRAALQREQESQQAADTAQADAADQLVVVADPSVPMWPIVIFAGDKQRVQLVKLPLEEAETELKAMEEAHRAQSDPESTVTPAGEPTGTLKQFIDLYFTGA